jgi:phospholipid/cholesterol/gamma-HCH transport system substrate-binding protein
MVTRTQKIRLGIFITITMTIVIITVGTLSFDRIFDTKDIYFIAYEDVSVSGLDIGSQVKYLGLNVGNVRNIEIDPKDINRIIVTIAIDEGTPIKEDVRAEISTIGITGLKQIELRGGTVESDMLKPGGYIHAGKSITEDITGRAEIITEKIELVLNNLLELTSAANQNRIFDFVDESAATVRKVSEIVDENRESMNKTISNLDTLVVELKLASIAARNSAKSFDQFLASDTLSALIADMQNITNTVRGVDLSKLMEDLNEVLVSINGMLDHTEMLVLRNSGKLIDTIDELYLTTRYLSTTARRIESNPSILIRGSRPNNPPDNRLEP